MTVILNTNNSLLFYVLDLINEVTKKILSRSGIKCKAFGLNTLPSESFLKYIIAFFKYSKRFFKYF